MIFRGKEFIISTKHEELDRKTEIQEIRGDRNKIIAFLQGDLVTDDGVKFDLEDFTNRELSIVLSELDRGGNLGLGE